MIDDHRQALPRGCVLDDYRIERLIGHGGFGLTYLGVHSRIFSHVAIKEYLPAELAIRERDHSVAPKSTSDQELFEWGRERFLDEARALGQFKHRNIVRVLNFFEAHGTAYIVMDYVDGRNLDAILKESGPVDQHDLVRLLSPLLDGLATIHRKSFLHRDIKPSNIMIQDDTPVLIDFGAARQALGQSRSITSIVTPGYAPIEQYSSSGGNQGPWTDIYALGAVAYRALTGKRPPDATDRYRKDPMVPASVAAQGRCHPKILAAIDWALAVNEEDRPQSVEDWSAALRVDEKEQDIQPKEQRIEEPPVPIPVPDPPQPRPQPADLPRPSANFHSDEIRKLPAPFRLIPVLIFGSLIVAIAGFAIYLQLEDEPDRIAMSYPYPPPSPPAPQVKLDPIEVESGIGLSRDDQIQVQRALNELRYDAGAADGVFGARTRAAIRNFQELNGHEVTGYLTPEQVDRLVTALQLRTTPGGAFADCDGCPEMVIVPAGEFMMGSPESETGRDADEGPQRKIRIAKPFAVGKFEVSRGEYEAFVTASGYASTKGCHYGTEYDETSDWRSPPAPSRADDDAPVVCVSWADAKAYVDWLRQRTGRNYWLLSEAEWEYAARANTTGPYPWGDTIKSNQCNGCAESDGGPAVAGSYPPNGFGLYDMHGNVEEWVEDCYADYALARGNDASPQGPATDCESRATRGGYWADQSEWLRSAYRKAGDVPANSTGFRVARSL